VYYNGVNNPSTDVYTTTVTVTPQYYATGEYNGLSLAPGMYTTNAFDGFVYLITAVENATPTSADLTLSDVNGVNGVIDSSGFAGGGPLVSSGGYVFQINPYTKLPILTSLPILPSLTFTDSILGRFIYEQTSETLIEGPTGSFEKFSFDGPTGSILFYDGNSITGTSNVTYNTNAEGTGTINITNLVIENIIFSGTGTADIIIDNFFGCIIELKAKKIELMKIMDDYFTQKTNRLALLNSTIA
jgi:hypothetical protein